MNQFDSAVLSVYISEWLANNKIFTPAIIFRSLTGKVGRGDAEPSKDQLAAIFHSINKLMRLQLTYNMADICEKLNYNGGKPELLVSTLLPSHYIKASTINSKDTTTIYFTTESPMLKIARLKNEQLLTYDVSLLDVPNQQNTPMNIAVKNYFMQRIQEIKLHRLTPIITFEDVFKKCRIDNAHGEIKRRARETTIAFMNHLKSQSEIFNFEVTKKAMLFIPSSSPILKNRVKSILLIENVDLTCTANMVTFLTKKSAFKPVIMRKIVLRKELLRYCKCNKYRKGRVKKE